MSDNATNTRLSARLTGKGTSRPRLITADIQRRKGSPFVSPVETPRTALWVAAETPIRESISAQRAPQ
jgi:hypothetical protein